MKWQPTLKHTVIHGYFRYIDGKIKAFVRLSLHYIYQEIPHVNTRSVPTLCQNSQAEKDL